MEGEKEGIRKRNEGGEEGQKNKERERVPKGIG